VTAGTGVEPLAGATPTTADDSVAARVDRLSEQVDRIAAMLQAQQDDRARWQELAHELTGVAQGAMSVASRELEDLSADVSAEDITRFLRTATRTLPKLEVMLTWAAGLEELTTELTALSGSGVASLSELLGRAESRGYFAAARAGGRIADRMALAVLAEADAEPPSAFALLRRLRDPQMRRGLARALALVEALGEQANGHPGTTNGGPATAGNPATTTGSTTDRPGRTPAPSSKD
jgi:hypothetical protein